MSWLETLRTAGSAIRAHRLRSLLTMLGIVIGISSVVLTVGLGLGAQNQVRSQIDALGSNLLIVSPGSSTGSGGVRGGFGSASSLTPGRRRGDRRPEGGAGRGPGRAGHLELDPADCRHHQLDHQGGRHHHDLAEGPQADPVLGPVLQR
jgi:hypothetical protein